MLGGVVDAEYGRAAHEGRKVGGERADQRLVDAGSGQIAEQALARRADQDRQAERLAQGAGQRQRLQVLRSRLAEADAGIEKNACAGYAGAIGEHERASKESLDVRLDVEIGIDALPVVHDRDGGAALGDHIRHRGVLLQSPDVVDH